MQQSKYFMPILYNTSISMILVLFIYVAFFYFVDKPVMLWAHTAFAQSSKFFKICAWLGDSVKTAYWGILALIAAVLGGLARPLLRNPNWARSCLFFAACVLVAMGMAYVLKHTLGRARPVEYLQHNMYGFRYFTRDYNFLSSPSGHATGAFAGLLALGYIIRRHSITCLLLIGATLLALSRLVISKHYAGDILLGAYLGVLAVVWIQCFFPPRISYYE